MIYDILINMNSGSLEGQTPETLTSLLHAKLGPKLRHAYCATGAQIGENLKTILSDKPDALIIGGGDGTISLCAHECVTHGLPFGILPLGTMNLLARDLSIPLDLDECLDGYAASPRHAQIDAASVNGQHFFCNSIIGVVPEASVEREQLRKAASLHNWHSFVETIVGSMQDEDVKNLYIRMRNLRRPVKAKSIIVANNAYTHKIKSPGDRLARENLTAGRMTIYTAAPSGFYQSLRLFVRLLSGQWQKDPSVKSFHRKEMIIEAPDDKLLVAVDGEPTEMKTPLKFKIHPLGAKIIKPA